MEEKWCVKCKKKVLGLTYCGKCGTHLVAEEPKWCKNCKLESFDLYCTKCGQKLESLEKPKPVKWCKDCNLEGENFCMRCGKQLQQCEVPEQDAVSPIADSTTNVVTKVNEPVKEESSRNQRNEVVISATSADEKIVNADSWHKDAEPVKTEEMAKETDAKKSSSKDSESEQEEPVQEESSLKQRNEVIISAISADKKIVNEDSLQKDAEPVKTEEIAKETDAKKSSSKDSESEQKEPVQEESSLKQRNEVIISATSADEKIVNADSWHKDAEPVKTEEMAKETDAKKSSSKDSESEQKEPVQEESSLKQRNEVIISAISADKKIVNEDSLQKDAEPVKTEEIAKETDAKKSSSKDSESEQEEPVQEESSLKQRNEVIISAISADKKIVNEDSLQKDAEPVKTEEIAKETDAKKSSSKDSESEQKEPVQEESSLKQRNEVIISATSADEKIVNADSWHKDAEPVKTEEMAKETDAKKSSSKDSESEQKEPVQEESSLKQRNEVIISAISADKKIVNEDSLQKDAEPVKTEEIAKETDAKKSSSKDSESEQEEPVQEESSLKQRNEVIISAISADKKIVNEDSLQKDAEPVKTEEIAKETDAKKSSSKDSESEQKEPVQEESSLKQRNEVIISATSADEKIVNADSWHKDAEPVKTEEMAKETDAKKSSSKDSESEQKEPVQEESSLKQRNEVIISAISADKKIVNEDSLQKDAEPVKTEEIAKETDAKISSSKDSESEQKEPVKEESSLKQRNEVIISAISADKKIVNEDSLQKDAEPVKTEEIAKETDAKKSSSKDSESEQKEPVQEESSLKQRNEVIISAISADKKIVNEDSLQKDAEPVKTEEIAKETDAKKSSSKDSESEQEEPVQEESSLKQRNEVIISAISADKKIVNEDSLQKDAEPMKTEEIAKETDAKKSSSKDSESEQPDERVKEDDKMEVDEPLEDKKTKKDEETLLKISQGESQSSADCLESSSEEGGTKLNNKGKENIIGNDPLSANATGDRPVSEKTKKSVFGENETSNGGAQPELSCANVTKSSSSAIKPVSTDHVSDRTRSKIDPKEQQSKKQKQQQHPNQYQHQYKTINHGEGNTTPTNSDPMWWKIRQEDFSKRKTVTIQFFVTYDKSMAAYFSNNTVVIFFSSRKLGNWNYPVVKMNHIYSTQEYVILTGELVVPHDYLNNAIGYKYVVLDAHGAKFEVLYTPVHGYVDGFRNRLLKISNEMLEKCDFLYQIDDIFLPPVEKEWKFFRRIFGSSNVKKMMNLLEKAAPVLFMSYLNLSWKLLKEDKNREILFLNALYSGFFCSYTRMDGDVQCWRKILHNQNVAKEYIKTIRSKIQINVRTMNTSSVRYSAKLLPLYDSLSAAAYMTPIASECSEDFISALFESLSLESFTNIDNLFWEDVKKTFSGHSIEMILNGLRVFLKKALRSNASMSYAHSWCYPLLLIHFLSEKCNSDGEPLEKNMTVDNTNGETCGLDCIKEINLNDKFLNETFNMLNCIRASLKVDKLLQRSLVYKMKGRHYPIAMSSGLFGNRLIIRMMLIYVKSNSFKKEEVGYLTSTIYQLKEKFETSQDLSTRERPVLLDTLFDLLIQLPEKIPTIADNEPFYTELIEATNAGYASLSNVINPNDEQHNKMMEMLSKQINSKLLKVGKVVNDCMIHKSCWKSVDNRVIEKELTLIERFLVLKFADVESSGKFRKDMFTLLREKIAQIHKEQELNFIKVYSNLDITTFEEDIQDVFQEICSTLLTTIAENPNSGGFVEILWGRKGSSIILCEFFRKEWKKKKTLQEQLEHCLTWSPMKSFLKMFAASKTDGDIDDVIYEAVSVLSYASNELVNSNITISLLEILHRKKEVFCSLTTCIGNNDANGIKVAFDKRTREIQTFKQAKNILYYFLNICKQLLDGFGDVSILHDKVMAEDIKGKPIKDFYHPEDGILPYFQITSEFYTAAEKLCNYDALSVVLFKKICRDTIKKIAKSGEIGLIINHEQIFKVVIKPVLKVLSDTIKNLVLGETTFNRVLRLFTGMHLNTLVDQLERSNHLSNEEYRSEDVKCCAQKVKCLFQLQTCINTTEKFLLVKERLQLGGDFSTISKIKSKVSTDGDQQLKDIDEDIVKNSEKLLDVSEEMLKILDTVSNCLPIVQWLKQNLKVPKEVKVFVEMMSIAAGENDLEVDRVACFEASCNAFSEIIFGLGEMSGFTDLYNSCKKTASGLANDGKMIEKMIDTNRYVEWFKQAKEAQGSVATKSIMQAKAANRKGKYIIGNIRDNCERFIQEEATLKEVIQLVVENDDEKSQVYKLDEIRDLQSRLMLLGRDKTDRHGENKEQEKDYFVETSDVVTRLANVYVSLCEAGAVKWLHLKMEVKCDIAKACEIGMEAWYKELREKIFQLEEHLKEWKRDLSEYREKYPLLNYFTVKQCLVLQKHLYYLHDNIGSVISLPPQVFALLRVIDDDVSVVKIKNAFMMSMIDDKEVLNKDWETVAYEKPTNFNQMSYQKIAIILEKLQQEHKFDENVALACLTRVFPFDMNKAIIWCHKQDPDSDLINEIAEDAERELIILKETYASIEVNEEKNTTEDFAAPFLLFNQFVQFLKELDKNSTTEKVQRNIPDYLNKEKPSLLVLSEDHILYGILELYLQQDGSLPCMEEVLFCTDEVSLEQIELLILRAVYNPYGIYCLVFADSLGYDKSERVFNFSRSLMSQGFKNPLVFVCSSENESRSYLTSALDAYKVKLPVYPQRERIGDLLQKQLCLTAEVKKFKEFQYAAQVDTDCYNTRVIRSEIGGMGKSLVVTEKVAALERLTRNSFKHKNKKMPEQQVVTTPVHSTSVEIDDVVDALCVFEEKPEDAFPRIYHFDIAPTVSYGLDCFLFNLVILGYCQASNGKVWRKNKQDLCLIEVTNNVQKKTKERSKARRGMFLHMLPSVTCISPEETYRCLLSNEQVKRHDWLFNTQMFKNTPMQRVYQYLTVYDVSPDDVNNFTFQPNELRGDHADCLRILIKYCGVERPSWMELRNFVHFFNQQLLDSEKCIFTNPILSQDLRGFKAFVVKFLLEMAKDFSTRSLTESDIGQPQENKLMVELKRHWEQSSHPYLFFNQDGQTLSFLGFNVDPNGNLTDPEQEFQIIQKNIMSKNLFDDLMRQMAGDLVTLSTNYQMLNRSEKLQILCRVMGLKYVQDPDPTYELTIDNMKKILAIHMRLRCGIPVILMGETGCGKTRLIRFMCALRAGLTGAINMLLVKVHGGVSAKDIKRRINEAINLAKVNYERHGISTILFLDEANTTDGIGLIKEIMIDKRVYGKPIAFAKHGLEIIAACNPYRRHTEEMVAKLESAGLGYHVSAALTYEKIGDIPLRQLVYRVHPLPESMKPLVWDFGQLNAKTEQAYARQIIRRYEKDKMLPSNDEFVELLVTVLALSQEYMRHEKDECSFVSLRDVERAVQVTSWFYKKMEFLLELLLDNDNEEDECLVLRNRFEQSIDKQRRSLVLALGVCYIARLENRESYIDFIQQYFTGSFVLQNGAKQMKKEIARCQEMFLDELKLEDNIAKNKALCENVFMMVICIELRIPLFVVGKPGSSKSLAKTIVQDNMQGNMSKSELFGRFKQIFMSSYQCSPISTAESIINTFKQCSRFQDDKNLDNFTSVVVLDEVGLAEDSPRMPLKALHPLLEDGTDGSEDLTIDGDELKKKRVAFIGISNWSLDPAKMNRGIMLCRGQPDLNELISTAKDICGSDPRVKHLISTLLEPLAESYLKIYEDQKECEKLKKYKKEEFFGLRDFYSLIKMVFCLARWKKGIPSLYDIEHAVKRNFSGMDELDPWKIFKEHLQQYLEDEEELPAQSSLDLVKASFQDNCPCYTVRQNGKKRCSNARYLLVMTEEYAALPIIEERFLSNRHNVSVIFGSSFPKDQEFAQICRDINRIKMCMETGRTVVLLNMESLYESLYDALNQYYVYLGGKSYVDLGLGTHRVKCRVHEDFKLIVIADKETVYESFPIPLINRLEKHYVVTSTCMTKQEKQVVVELKEWAHDFSHVPSTRHIFDETDAFVSFNDDTCASIVIHLQNDYDDPDEIFVEGKKKLLQLATPDALVRLSKSKLADMRADLWQIYFEEQKHSSLHAFLKTLFCSQLKTECSFIQVTTFSRLLSPDDKNNLRLDGVDLEMISLMQFQTEQSFREAIRLFFRKQRNQRPLLILQCSNSAESNNLVACAQHICKEEKANSGAENDNACILFLLQLNHTHGGFKAKSGSQALWNCFHIDELREANKGLPSLIQYAGKSMRSLFDFKTKDFHNSEVIHIVKGCIQAAMKNLNEVKHMLTDEIRAKITILYDQLSLKTDLSLEFVHTIMGKINDNLHQKESLIMPEKVNFWVQQEAVEQLHLPEYGTFREALIRCVEDKVTPILTVLLNEIDQNKNLLILKNNPQYQELWVKLLKHAITVDVEKTKSISIERDAFSSQFPFSCQVMHIMEQIVKTHITKDSNKLNLLQINNAVKAHVVGRILDNLDATHIQDYIHDVIYSRFSCPSDEGYKVLCTSLLIGAKNVIKQAAKEDEIDTDAVVDDDDNAKDERKLFRVNITSVHVALNIYEERFENAISLFSSNPSMASKVLQIIDHNDEEVKPDALALREVLLSFVPQKDEMISQQSGYIWMSGIKEIKVLTKAIFYHAQTNSVCYGIMSNRIVDHAKLLWTKLRILQLYIDNVCPPGICSNQKERESIMALWKSVEDLEDNMISIASWNVIEKFIKLILTENIDVTNTSDTECAICNDILKDAVALPCLHTFCYLCVVATWFMEPKKCPVCNNDIPGDFELPSDEIIRTNKFKYGEFKRRCLTYFVEIVTEFCFARDNFEVIHPDVIKKIMGYAFHSSEHQTKEFSPIQEYALDPTPVIRSFLLQQLLKREDQVENYIEECLIANLKLAINSSDKWNICKLFIHCYEDHHSRGALILKSNDELNTKYISFLHSALKNVLNYFEKKPTHEEISVELLKNVALARLAVIGASSLLSKAYLPNEEMHSSQINNDLKRLFALLMKFIKDVRNSEGHMFLLRQVIRCHGSRELQIIIEKSQFDWLGLKTDEENELVAGVESDKFLVHGEEYQAHRDQLSEMMLQKADTKTFKQLKRDLATKQNYKTFIELAVLRECGLSVVPMDNEVAKVIENVFSLQNCFTNMNVLSGGVHDEVWKELLYHYMTLLKKYNEQGLMALHLTMVNNPANIQNYFLPTMPSDNFAEIAGARPRDGTGWVLHKCPQGHAYVITECGRAATRSICPECRSGIGGVNHQIDPGNTIVQNRDLTQPGHSLGSPQERLPYAAPERRLSSLSVAFQRLLVHLSMFLGTLTGKEQALCAMIIPRIPQNQVVQFFQNHLEQDFRVLAQVLGKSNEDVNIVVHMFLKHVTEHNANHCHLGQLATKEGRDAYEMQFHQQLIEPFIASLAKNLENVRKTLLGDVRIGANPLMRKLYELDEVAIPDFKEIELMTCSQFWSYREPITLEHFKLVVQERVIMSQGEAVKLLSSFLQMESLFRLINDLPDIIELQKILFAHFNYKLDRETANEITIKETITELEKDVQKKARRLFRRYITIWNELSALLRDYGRVKIDSKYHPTSMNFNTKLSYALCAREGPGRCAIALIDFLAFNQNEFLELCANTPGFQQNIREVSLVKLKANDIVSYTPEEDLLPLVYAHCDYSLEIGRGTKVEYNLASIEKRLIDNIFFGRANIVIQIEEFMYRDDVKSSEKFTSFNRAVQQKSIPYADRQKMMIEFTEIADISNALRAIEIAIGMLTATSGDPNMFYKNYLTDVLQMEADVFVTGAKMQNTIRLAHLASSWITLTVERAKRLHANRKEPFIVEEAFCIALEEDAIERIHNYLRHVDTRVLLSHLTEYIVSELPYRNENDAEFPLSEALEIYEDQKGVKDDEEVEEIPAMVELKHIYTFWKLVADANRLL
ncbi:E3 ubiquitin-protein ligase rnf213-alpha-like isoform X3 [Hydractinia symbiolongicarpus]|uniref:E3 ubiquitin-protein ligase rnf213-alpha-like isoform X3 n=1 Tax=Hydractinia symbiolongicarpus TaxID=13093 RepID=UPI00254AB63D|nr:E3 ubiquitin-protein ligase rnf213-alpha-like isoform X3 [Hydractinia symbiolongicarpus]